ncbi:MAG: peptide deformylase [Candidatus Nomurabacteria bacterium]|nr:peptide deformylase [Candidatus Nomurabacteria bacterium]
MNTDKIIIQINKRKDNPLRTIASAVKKNEFGTEELKNLVEGMQTSLAKEEDGVALAAPQIAISKRIFVISPKAYEENAKWKPLVFINPEIKKVSKKVQEMQEGCLSVRWIYGTTERHTSATVEAYDVMGNKFSFGASGLIAHIFQHEIDHLDGVLFIDHGYNLEEYKSEEEYKAKKGIN